MRTNLELRPFHIPNFIIVKESDEAKGRGGPARKFRVDELHPDTLATMCDDFRAAIFEKAGKADPLTKN